MGACLPYGEGITYWPLAEALSGPRRRPRRRGRPADGRPRRRPASPGRWPRRSAASRRRELRSPGPCAACSKRWPATVRARLHDGRRAVGRAGAARPRRAPRGLRAQGAVLVLCLPGRSSSTRAGGRRARRRRPCSSRSPPPTRRRSSSGWPRRRGRACVTDRRVGGGNPLFAEQLLAMALEDGGGSARLPPPSWRSWPPASTGWRRRCGRCSRTPPSRAGCSTSAPCAPRCPTTTPAPSYGLEELVRADLVRPAPAEVAGDSAHAFRNQLIRDVAYERLSKQRRAEVTSGWLVGSPTAGHCRTRSVPTTSSRPGSCARSSTRRARRPRRRPVPRPMRSRRSAGGRPSERMRRRPPTSSPGPRPRAEAAIPSA